ncbi:MAG: IgA Peptidase M64 [Pirellulaceae bacterium]
MNELMAERAGQCVSGRVRFWLGMVGLSVVASVRASAQDPAGLPEPVCFEEYFCPQTMRVDYFHSGDAREDRIALERVVRDGSWAGSRTQMVDALDLGLYGFEVRDCSSQRLLYRRGFCSVFGEWQTTLPAQQVWGTYHESLRFPWPRQPVDVVLKRRHEGDWRELWKISIDPHSRFVVRADTPPAENVWTVFENGSPAEKVDLLLLGDGYTRDDLQKFHMDVRRLVERLFAEEPFHSRRGDFNVRAVDVVSGSSGISQPREGIFHRSALSCQYNTFDLERYALTFDNRTVRDLAAAAPYDNLIILLNSTKYGGGGIYNDQTTVAADSPFADYILVHEFGHHLAGLGDEYYVSNVAYVTGKLPLVEPWEPNVTALLDPSRLKWKDLVDPQTPIPTPWKKDEYEAAAQQIQQRRQQGDTDPQGAALDKRMEKSMREEQAFMTELLGTDSYAGRVGAFEGAGYEAKGLYRPTVDCLMFSRNKVGFCPVCRRAIERAIDQQIGRRASVPGAQ